MTLGPILPHSPISSSNPLLPPEKKEKGPGSRLIKCITAPFRAMHVIAKKIDQNKETSKITKTFNIHLKLANVIYDLKTRDIPLKEIKIDGQPLSKEDLITILPHIKYADFTGFDLSEFTTEELENLINSASNLKRLTINSDQITSLTIPKQIEYCDLSGCTKLARLDCNCCDKLTHLNVNNATALTEIDCRLCISLESINLHGATELKKLQCTQSKLTTLDLSDNHNLIELQCDGNEHLKSLELASATKLETLSCGQCKTLKRLDLSANTALTRLLCFECTQLTDLKPPSKLEHLNCRDCKKLASINLLGNFVLTEINCSGCSLLTTLKCKTCVRLQKLNASATALTDLDCRGLRFLTDLNLSNATALINLNCRSCSQLTSIDLSACSALTHLVCSNCKQLETLKLSACSALTHLDCNVCNQLTSIDLSAFSELEYFDCGSCSSLKSLDLSKNTKLTELQCSKCRQLTAIDLSAATALSKLDCSYCTVLATIDLPSNPVALTEIQCEDCGLQNLDLSKAKELQKLKCKGCNQLTSIDLSHAGELTVLICEGCTSLASIDLTEAAKLEEFKCMSCSNLTTIKANEEEGLPNCKYFDCRFCPMLIALPLLAADAVILTENRGSIRPTTMLEVDSKELEENPMNILMQLGEKFLLVNKPFPRIVFEGSSGEDYGGLSRQLVSSLFEGLVRDETLFTGDVQNKLPLLAANGEAEVFRTIGRLFATCLESLSSGGKYDLYDSSMRTGVHFDPNLFTTIRWVMEDKERLKTVHQTIKDQSNLVAIRQIMETHDGTAASQIKEDKGFLSTIQEIAKGQDLEQLRQTMEEDELDTAEIDSLLTAIRQVRENPDLSKMEDAELLKLLQPVVEHQVLLFNGLRICQEVHCKLMGYDGSMADTMKGELPGLMEGNPIAYPAMLIANEMKKLLKEKPLPTTDLEFTRKIQGFEVNIETLLNGIELTQGTPKDQETMQGFLKEWVQRRDETWVQRKKEEVLQGRNKHWEENEIKAETEEEHLERLAKFVFFATGSRSLSDKKIKLSLYSSRKGCPEAHTCNKTLDVPLYKNIADFEYYFKQALAVVNFGFA